MDVKRGKLKFKGSGSNEKSKKKKTESKEVNISEVVNAKEVETNLTSIPETKIENIIISTDDTLTEAEKKFLKRKQESEERAIKTLTKVNYRDRVEEFNSKLSNLTEHNDIPRISAAGNG